MVSRNDDEEARACRRRRDDGDHLVGLLRRAASAGEPRAQAAGDADHCARAERVNAQSVRAFGDPLDRWASATGSFLEICRPKPDVVVERASGRGELGGVRMLIKNLDPIMASGVRLSIFGDWSKMDGYDAEARQALMDWTLANQRRLAGIHLLVSSRLVAMAVSVANLATSGVTKAYTDRARWQAELDKALA